MNPVIVIGLGGTGKEVLMLLRKKVVQRFTSLARFPILGVLHLDSDISIESQAVPSTQYLGEDIALAESERLTLPVTGGENWKNNEAVRDWFPPDLAIPSNFQTGCQAQRNYGRLAFSANIDVVRDRINRLAAQVTNPDVCRQFAADSDVAVQPNLDLFIVCSLLGGTGSGMVFDLCYLAKAVLSSYGSLHYGYLVTGGPTAKEDQKANCYAALMELDWYNQRGFEARYPGTQMPRILDREGPVHWMYLANGINSEGVAVPPEVVWETVADNIFSEITPGIKDRRKGIRNNFGNAGYGERDKIGKPQCYISFGMSSIEFPALNLQDALSYRLAADTLAAWSYSEAPQEDHVRLVDRDIELWRLRPDSLEDDLLKDDSGISHIKRINGRAGEQKAECLADGLLAKDQRAALRQRVETHLRNNDTDIERRAAVAQSGATLKQIDHRRETLLAEAAQRSLHPRIRAIIADGLTGGTRNARGYLDAFESRLRNFLRDHQERANHWRREAERAYDEKAKLFEVFVDDLSESKLVVKKHIEDLLESSVDYQRAQVRLAANEMARAFLDSLMTEVGALKSRASQYETSLQHHGAECRAQYERRVASILAPRGLSDVMVNGGEVDDIYLKAVPDVLPTAIGLRAKVQERPDLPDVVFTNMIESPTRVVESLVRAAKEEFVSVRDTSVASKLDRLKPEARDNKIQIANRNAHVLIQLDHERRHRFCNILAPENTEIVLIATPTPESEPSLAQGGPLRRAIEGQMPILAQNLVQVLPDRSRLVWSYELGAFSLHCVRDFSDYRQAYLKAQSRHRHTRTSPKFPDLFPADEEEIRKRAQRAVSLGRALGCYAQEKDPDTDEPVVYFYYLDKHGKHPIRLGEDWQAVEETLLHGQRDKDVVAASQGVTALERVEDAIAQAGARAATRTQKQNLWATLQTYLDGLESALAGGLRNPRHLQEAAYINEYRDRYDLTPPPVWPPSPSKASPVGTNAPTDEAASRNIDEFRQRVRVAASGGALTEQQILSLMEQSADFGLGFEEADRIISETQRVGPLEVGWTDKMFEYKTEYEKVLRVSGGGLGASHRAFLNGMARRLGLDTAQVSDVERLVNSMTSAK